MLGIFVHQHQASIVPILIVYVVFNLCIALAIHTRSLAIRRRKGCTVIDVATVPILIFFGLLNAMAAGNSSSTTMLIVAILLIASSYELSRAIYSTST